MFYAASRPTPRLYMTSLEAHTLNEANSSLKLRDIRATSYNSEADSRYNTNKGDGNEAGEEKSNLTQLGGLDSTTCSSRDAASVEITTDWVKMENSKPNEIFLKPEQVTSAQLQPTESESAEAEPPVQRTPTATVAHISLTKVVFYQQQRSSAEEYCKCSGQEGSGECPFAKKVIQSLIRSDEDPDLLKSAYDEAHKRDVSTEQDRVILTDVLRTYAELKVYQTPDSEATKGLCRVLRAFSSHYKNMGYVQGLNFIVASFKHHLQEEWLTFWAVIYLFNLLDLHRNFTAGRSKPTNQRLAWFAPPFFKVSFETPVWSPRTGRAP